MPKPLINDAQMETSLTEILLCRQRPATALMCNATILGSWCALAEKMLLQGEGG